MRPAAALRRAATGIGGGKPGAARTASPTGAPGPRGGLAETGTRPALGSLLPGYTPQISQRRAHGSVPGGWQDPPDRARAGAQEEEQLWGSK
jgi:hypothetical protein